MVEDGGAEGVDRTSRIYIKPRGKKRTLKRDDVLLERGLIVTSSREIRIAPPLLIAGTRFFYFTSSHVLR